MWGAGLVKLSLAATVGAGLAYAFDPARGRRRRAELRDRGGAVLRREVRAVERQAHYGKGRATGLVHRLRQGPPHTPEDDMTLVDKVRSEALGRIVEGPHLTVDANERVIKLRGQVTDRDTALAIEREVRAVPGVEDVINLLHVPGVPAPNKVAALRANASTSSPPSR
jgi:osmotically-inducible protein OsmY